MSIYIPIDPAFVSLRDTAMLYAEQVDIAKETGESEDLIAVGRLLGRLSVQLEGVMRQIAINATDTILSSEEEEDALDIGIEPNDDLTD